MEASFSRTYRRQFETFIVSGMAWKLARLDSLYFLHGLIKSCENPPDDIPIGEVVAAKPADWWTPADDRALLYGTWKDGYMQYSDIKFSQDEEVPGPKLTSRMKSLITGLKTAFVKYKQQRGEELPFNCDTLRRALNSWSKKEHRLVCHILANFGFPSPEEVVRVGGFSKPVSDVSEYFQDVVTFCYEVVNGETPQMRNVVEKIQTGSCVRIVKRVELFKAIRKNVDCSRFKDEDVDLFHYLAANGFLSLSESKLITDRFGTESIEGKVVKYVKTRLKDAPKKIVSLAARGEIPPYARNADGSPVFPIRLGNSMVLVRMGTVVADKEGFHSQRYVYPDGYLCERLYQDIDNPDDKTWYNCRIFDRGGDQPVFRVELKDNPLVGFEGNAPSNPWLMVVKRVDEKRRKTGSAGNRTLTISGPEYFGLSSPLVIHLMQQMEGVDQLAKFEKRTFLKPDVDDDDDDELSEDASQVTLAPAQARHSQRIRQKGELTLDFGLVKDLDIWSGQVVMKTNELLQRDALDISFPFDGDPLREALERMAVRVSKELTSMKPR
jgi:chromodomain-helicase-DNA-binding protein 7